MGTIRQTFATLREAAAAGRLDVVCDRISVDLLVVFGSVTDSTVAEPHDLDVAVRFSPGTAADLVATTVELMTLVDHGDVDVLDLGRADVVARSRALGPRCEPLYERAPGMFALAQMAAMTEAMDTAWMRRRDLELLARR